MNLVIGSGPTGVMAASALLEAGAEVTMLDVGDELDAGRQEAIRELGALAPEAWDPALLERIRPREEDDSGLPKLSYGSDYPYSREEAELTSQSGTRCLTSFAKGGLSAVWGAAVLPNAPEDFVDWPVSFEEMAPSYAAAGRLLGIAGAKDELESRFPYYAPPAAPPEPSRQAAALLERMRANRGELERRGFAFGRSRLALRAAEGEDGSCRRVGLCLSGCPYSAIWSSARVLDVLRRHPRFDYRPRTLLLRVSSRGSSARALCRPSRGGAAIELDASRVFLACGPLSTARVLIDSMRAHGKPFALRYQPYFLLPMLALKNTPRPDQERLHSLAQIFLELLDPKLSPHTVHLQVYGYNDMISRRLDRALRLLGPLRGAARAALLGRLLAVQGYLHSDEAGEIRLEAAFDPALDRSRISLSGAHRPGTLKTIRSVSGRLAGAWRGLGAAPLSAMLRVGDPGEGNHIGAIFPMRRRPTGFESDSLGSLPGLARVHAVDSSILPSLAATTITYTAMANAHRIAAACARIDSEGAA